MSVALPVRRGDGSAAMLKVLDPAFAAREVLALRAFPPDASVLLYEHDPDAGALLLERLTPVTVAALDDADAMITVEADLARRLAVPDPGGLPLINDTAGWADQLVEQRSRAPLLLPPRVVDAALEMITGLAADRTTTLTHGDLHAGNVLRDHDGRWRTIDPNPSVGPVAVEAHTVVRDRLSEVVRLGSTELSRRLALFAEVSGADVDLCVRLCQARAVSSALYEHLRGAAALAEELAWMALVLTPTIDISTGSPEPVEGRRRKA